MWDQMTQLLRSVRENILLEVFPMAQDFLSALGITAPTYQRLVIAICVGLMFIALYLIALILFRKRTQTENGPALAQLIKGPRRIGFAAIFLLVAFFGGWSAIAPLSSAAVALGVVNPEGSRKVVKHLEGGIVQTISVKEGDQVAAGQPLVILVDLEAKARFEELYERYLYFSAVEARLLAERDDANTIEFSSELLTSEEPRAQLAMTAQEDLLASRRASQLSRERILEKRIAQLEEQNAGIVEMIVAQDRQISLLNEEIANVRKLYENGLAKYPRLLELLRIQADIEVDKAANVAKIAANGERIGETELQLLTMSEQRVEKANDDLTEVQRSLSELRTQLPSRRDTLARTVVRAPISGTIINLQTRTIGGVIGAGETILEIVPRDSALIIDARVRPNDIDRVHPGMEARVILSAYKQRSLPLIHGVLTTVSADRIVEDRTGEPYFLAKIEMDTDMLKDYGDIQLVSGMPAEIMLLDEERTLFNYFVAPLLQSVKRSFLES